MTTDLATARRRLHDRARDWIDAHLEDFAVEEPGEAILTPTKRFGELAMMASLRLDRGEDARARAWLELAWMRFEHGALLARGIAAQPALVAMYPAFHRHGLRSADVERAIAAALPSVDDPTLRLLVACSLAPTGLAMPWRLDELLADSLLAREPAAWTIDARAAYVIGHVALFLAPGGALAERYRGYLARSLPAWIAHFVHAGDLDLVSELIMVAHTLGTCVADGEWQVLIDAQEPDGLVPFRAAWRGREVPPRMRFIANYHSTLVAYAAAAMCSHARAPAPPVRCLADLFVDVD